MTHTHLYQTSVWSKGREERKRDQAKETVGGKEDKRWELKAMRCLCLTFSIVQQKENSVFRDDEFPQLHHVGHRVRHDCPLSASTVAAFPQTLQ